MNYVIIIAGGVGTRLGAGIPKQFVDVLGKPVIAYTMEHFQNHPEIDAIELVCVDGYQEHLKRIVEKYRITKVIKIVKGGSEYEYSIMNGVVGLEGIAKPDDIIMIHWSASPFINEEIISDNILTASKDSDLGSIELRFNSDANSSPNSDGTLSKQLKIAIIDNDLMVIKHLKESLETIGEITVFISSKDFLAKVQQNQFDIAITGMFMPEVTGLDILHFLIEKHIDLPVIVYSSIVQKELIMQTLKMGASSYLIKPQPTEVLVQKVLEIINAKQ